MMRGREKMLVMLTLTRSSFWHSWKGGLTWLGGEAKDKGLRGSRVRLGRVFRTLWGATALLFSEVQKILPLYNDSLSGQGNI